MKPLNFLKWSGRVWSCTPPAGITVSRSAVLDRLWPKSPPREENTQVFTLPKRTPGGVIKTGLAFALGFLVLCGPPDISQAQSGYRLIAWGCGWEGETNIPPGLSNVVAISAQGRNNLALKSDGTVVAWGDNEFGQTNVPPGLNGVVAVAAGWDCSLALKSDGTVVAWGDNSFGQTDVPPGLSHVIALAVRNNCDNNLALKSDGTVVVWGGVGDETNVPAGLNNLKAIAAAYDFLGLKSNGTVVAWRGGSYDSSVPADLTNVIAIAAGSCYLALKSDGTVVAWGNNYYGQTNVPPGLSNVIAIAAGSNHSLALKSDHTVVAWGDNGWGQTNVPTGLTGVTAIAGGCFHSIALTGQAIIQSQPLSQTATVGFTVQFQAQADSAMPRTNQWFFNATNLISGATDVILQLTNVQSSQSGTYTLVVSNCFGSVTSSPAMLTVTEVPVIVNQSTNQRIWPGGTADFSVAATSTLPLAYQWFFGTNIIFQGTNSTLHLVNVQPSQAGTYVVVVTNVYGAATSAPVMLEVYSAIIVTNCTEASLRAAMAGWGVVHFACDGTITLSNTITCSTNAAFDGTGHNVTISGGGKVQVFYVNPNVTLSVSNLTIAGGFSSNGAGLFNNGGTVNLNGVTFRRNYAPWGGAVYNAAGHMNLQSCCFTNNRAWAINVSQATFGGAIYNADSMYLDLCQFGGNSAGGADGTFVMGIGSVAPADGSGGAIYNSGQLTIDRTTLIANVAFGGGGYTGTADYYTWNGDSGGSGANGFGGGICNAGSLSISRSTLCGNIVEGGGGGHGGNGIWNMDIGGSGGAGSFGGTGTGGALYGGGSLVNCTIAFNTAQGGTGGAGGEGAGGIPGPSGYGGNGGNGGNGIDGGVSGSGSFVNCTIAGNQSVAGAAGAGGYAPAYGTTGLPGTAGYAWGATPTGFQLNVLLFSNTPDGNDTFANLRLGPLADNGGPTLTMALLPGSPAINAGTASGAPATDQRGVPRPQGAGVDIGAFEYLYSPVFTGVMVPNTTNRQLQMSGLTPNSSLTLQASTNLLMWFDVTNFTAGTNGAFQCVDPVSGDVPMRFYRLKSVSP